VAVRDSAGSSDSRTIHTVTVANVIPVAGAISGTGSGIPGQAFTLTAPFIDLGILDTHTGTFVWGDGTSTTVNAVEPLGSGTVSATHIYAASGTYTVTLTVTDDDGGVSLPVTFTVTVTQSAYQLSPSGSGAFTASGNAQLTSSLVVSTLAVTGSSGAFHLNPAANAQYASSTSNWITNGILTVSVQDDTGSGLDAGALARLGDAMLYLNETLGGLGVHLSWAAPGTLADVHVHFASTTPEGGANEGVIGFTTPANDVYFVTGGVSPPAGMAAPSARTSTTSGRWPFTSWPIPWVWARTWIRRR
jgi:hypothetical protein